MTLRFVDADGNNYNPSQRLTGPYGPTHVFTGPKVLVIYIVCYEYTYIATHSIYYIYACIKLLSTVYYLIWFNVDSGICKAVLWL